MRDLKASILKPLAPSKPARPVRPTIIKAEPEPAAGDGRRSYRKSSRTPAQIVPERGAVPITCTVTDISATGARLVLNTQERRAFTTRLHIPLSFVLIIPNDRIEVDCTVARRTDNQVGVKFVSSFRTLRPAARPRV